MNTGKNNSALDSALAGITPKFRSKIKAAYVEIREEHARKKYDSCGLQAGKLCECVLRFLQKELTNSNVKFGTKIPNFTDECKKLTQVDRAKGHESLRITIPRALDYLYTMRNKRGIGHVGGDVDSNFCDSTVILQVSSWIICELIRIYHGMSLEEAQELVESLSAKRLPNVWEVAGKKRVLKPGLTITEEVLVLCYSCSNGAVFGDDLLVWTKYSNPTTFKSNILSPLDKKKLIEYDRQTGLVILSPLGIDEVEGKILN